MIEIGITPNRPDALGVSGIAKDLAAAGLGTVKTPAIDPIKGEGACPVSCRPVMTDGAADILPGLWSAACAAASRTVRRRKWMQQRLKAIGLRPISALVDVTNYVTFDRGRPLHVFDADKVKGDLAVRQCYRRRGGPCA